MGHGTRLGGIIALVLEGQWTWGLGLGGQRCLGWKDICLWLGDKSVDTPFNNQIWQKSWVALRKNVLRVLGTKIHILFTLCIIANIYLNFKNSLYFCVDFCSYLPDIRFHNICEIITLRNIHVYVEKYTLLLKCIQLYTAVYTSVYSWRYKNGRCNWNKILTTPLQYIFKNLRVKRVFDPQHGLFSQKS